MAENALTQFPLLLGPGSASAPSLYFGDAGSGLYRVGANLLGISIAGVLSQQFSQGVTANIRYGDNPGLRLYCAGGTASAPAATVDGNNLGDVICYAHNGTSFVATATMRMVQDGAVSGPNVPTKISLYSRSSSGSLVEGLTVRASGNVEIKKGATLGGAATDVLTCVGRLALRAIANTTNRPGTKREIVYNDADNKVYVCTAASETAATWAALN